MTAALGSMAPGRVPAGVRAPPLRVHRAAAAPEAGLLGRLDYAPLRQLADGAPLLGDCWLGGHGVRHGRTGAAAWATDGHWTYADLRLPVHGRAGDPAVLARRGFAELFDALDAAGTPHPLRMWSQVPRAAHAGDDGEWQSRFVAGFGQACADAARCVAAGAPASSLVAAGDAALSVRCLAGRRPPLALSVARSDTQPGSLPAAALAELGAGRLGLFVGGSAGIRGFGGGEGPPPADLREQVGVTLGHLRTVLADAARVCDAHFRIAHLALVVYLRHAGERAAVTACLADLLGADAAVLGTALVLRADLGGRAWRVAIEGHAVEPGALR